MGKPRVAFSPAIYAFLKVVAGDDSIKSRAGHSGEVEKENTPASSQQKAAELAERRNVAITIFMAEMGYSLKALEKRPLDRPRRGEHGEGDGKGNYRVNPNSLYVAQDIFDSEVPTRWLDMAWGIASDILPDFPSLVDYKAAEQAMLEFLEKAKVLAPIQLTTEGDFFALKHPVPSSPSNLPEPTNDLSEFRKVSHYASGWHPYCGGEFYWYRTSATHDVLCCHRCNLRANFPNEIVTYGQMREHFQKRIAQTSSRT